MGTLALIGIGILLVYTTASVITFYIPTSLSDTYYLWLQKNEKLKWPFKVALILGSALLMPVMISMGKGNPLQFTGFLAPISLMFVAASSEFKSKILPDKPIHMTMAFLSVISVILWEAYVMQNMGFLLVSFIICAVLALVSRTVKQSYVFWLECMCLLSLFCCIINYLFV